ncbi:unnamed protein product [Candidula unifasciata]|uniref:Receptor ligand binding region domain-containing protein n=1 Tax=Candidula unifasciata TaxID=100452 RepID=A0A8S3ZD89_9EUPU|nr:unnamed protein product [Candidula unifasciata]
MSSVLSHLSTESPSLSENCSTTAIQMQESTTAEPTSTIDIKQSKQPSQVLKIGVILAYSHRFPWVINKTRPAIEIAAEFVSSPAGPLSSFTIEIEYRDSRCSDTFGSLEGIDLYVKKLAHVFIGPSCDYSIAPLARFSYYWGIPILTAGALVEAFANKAEYKLLTRVQGSYTKSAEFFVSIALEYGWSQVGIVYHEVKYDGRGSRSNCAFTIEPIFYSVELILKSKPWHVSFNEKEATEETILSVMKQLAANCRR